MLMLTIVWPILLMATSTSIDGERMEIRIHAVPSAGDGREVPAPAQDQAQAEQALEGLRCELAQANGSDPDCLKRLGIMPRTPEQFNNQGWSRLQADHPEEALEDFSRALSLRPEYEIARVNRANAYSRLGKFTEALSDINVLLSKDPKSRAGLLNRCEILRNKRDLDKALIACSRAVALYPLDPVARNNRGYLYQDRSQYDEAVADYAEALRIDPSYRDARVNRARLFELRRAYPEAFADWETLIRLPPENVGSHLEYAQLQLRYGTDLKRARELVQRAVELAPDEPEVRWTEALVTARSGDRVALRASLLQFRKLQPDPFLKMGNLIHRDKAAEKARLITEIETRVGFESDTDRSFCFLEQQQRENYVVRTFPNSAAIAGVLKLPPEFFGPEVQTQLDTIIGARLPTRFENALGYAILKPLVEQVLGSDPARASGPHPRIAFGTTEAPDINGRAVPMPTTFQCAHPKARNLGTDQRILLINGRTFEFIYEMTKLLVAATPRKADGTNIAFKLDTATLVNWLDANPRFDEAFHGNVYKFLMVSPGSGLAFDPENAGPTESVVKSAELFVVAHEYAHIWLNHKLSTPDDESSLGTASSWLQELQADRTAMGTILAIARARSDVGKVGATAAALIAPSYFLTLRSVLDDADALHRTGQLPPKVNEDSGLISAFAALLDKASTTELDMLDKRLANVANDHPPIWLRAAMLRLQAAEWTRRYPLNGEEEAFRHLFDFYEDSARLFLERARLEFSGGPAMSLIQDEVNDIIRHDPPPAQRQKETLK